MKIIVKVDRDKELVSIHCDEECEVELFDYHACVDAGDATEEEMDREFEESIEGMSQIYDADTYGEDM